MKKYLLLLLVIMMYEGFGLLPESIVVPIPGFFRMRDIIFPVFFIVFFIKFDQILIILRKHTQASMIVTSFCLLICMGIIMANVHFGQSLLTGLLKLRDNFNFILFFILMASLDEKDISFFVRGLSFIVMIVGLLSIIQYFLPNIPIFLGKDIQDIYSGSKFLRLNEYRLYFPAGSLSVLLFCYIGAELIMIDKPKHFNLKCAFIIFLFILYIMQQTRARILTLIVVSLVGIFIGRKKSYKILFSLIAFLVITIQLLSFYINGEKFSIITENKIYRLTETVIAALHDQKVQEASIRDRLLQADMYLYYFKKYPITGAGTLYVNSPLSIHYNLYNTSDLGYLKFLCEYGLIGIAWLIWLFVYIYRKCKLGIVYIQEINKIPDIYIGIMSGTKLFYLYVFISMLTLPHFGRGQTIIYMSISLSLLEITFYFLRNKKTQVIS